jgi:hypothetical protein
VNKTNTATAVTDEEDAKPHLALVEPSSQEDPPVETSKEAVETAESGPSERAIRFDSLGVGKLDHFSLMRVFRDKVRMRIEYFQSEIGGGLSIEDAIEAVMKKVDDQEAEELYAKLLTKHADMIDFSELLKLWEHSPNRAESVWLQMKEEAHLDFMSGHLATMVFQPAGWMRTAWARAKFLALRDAFLDEYIPEGGVEVALVDTIAQSYFLQLHWTEVAVTRTRADPKRHHDEYQQWQAFKSETGRDHGIWYPGGWELLYATEIECQEQAIKMADHFARLFQRTVKALDNHRLAKVKLKRLKI